MQNQNNENSKCGFIAIIGRPNVGKSTLLNHLIGEKVSITADKPQTTRHRILGVKNYPNTQAVYIDTPGMHSSLKKEINKQMNRAAKSVINDVDAIIFVIEGMRFKAEDKLVLDIIQYAECPVFLAINKVDLQKDKPTLLPFIAEMHGKRKFAGIIPISAKTGLQVDVLEKEVLNILPNNPFFYPVGQVTDRGNNFRLAEIVREKLTRNLGQELPYALTVCIESIEQEIIDDEERTVVHAMIWVEKDSQKQIVIGKKGEKLKHIGSQARKDMNLLLKTRVHLQLWVKVRSGWSDNTTDLGNIAYLDLE